LDPRARNYLDLLDPYQPIQNEVREHTMGAEMTTITGHRNRTRIPREAECLAAELETARRRIIELMGQLDETARSRDDLRDRMQAMTWNARWGREQIGFGVL
jgi:hypothetical protein